jgi:hypothetical protein
MSDQTNQEQNSAIEQDLNLANPFSEESWADTPVKADQQQSQTEFDWNSVSTFQSDERETYDANEYLRMQLGFDDWDSAKSQIEELRRLKENQGSSIEFENDQSRTLYEYIRENKEDELITFLQEKKLVERLYNAEVKDIGTASDIVKLSMYQKNKTLEPEEINFLFNEKFAVPAKPQQQPDEFDADYEQRVASWENRVNEIEKKLIIEAKLAKPELESYRSSYVLPDLTPRQSFEGPSQEELESRQRVVSEFSSSVDQIVNSFDGFNATVRDEGADFNVAYVPSYEERQSVATQLKTLAESELNANVIFADRWVNDDMTINTQQMAKDLFLLQNEGKITQKYVNEAANRRLALHLKNQSNINFNNQTQSNTFAPDNIQSEMDRLASIMFAK